MDQNAKDAVNEVIASTVTGKKWYLSKTFWTNVIAAVAVTVQSKYGYVIPLELQFGVLSIANLVLRKITKEPVVW